MLLLTLPVVVKLGAVVVVTPSIVVFVADCLGAVGFRDVIVGCS